MEADFDIDAAFDEVVDRFVSEYVPVMKKIDAIDGLPDKGEERLEEHSARRAEAGGTAGCDPAGSVPFRSGARRDLSPSARNPDANRTITINHDQKDVFDKVIDEYRKKGADAWSLTNPCSDFAADVWNRVTGEDMSSLWILGRSL